MTVIGLGLMGQALVGAFLRDGHPTTVWNRTPAKAEALVAGGARLADSIGDAVAAGRLGVVCVSDYDAVHGLLDPLGDVLDGRVLVNLTSGTSTQARETAGWAARRGSTYLDGAIMTIPDGIGTPEAAVLYSGPRPAFDAYEGVLRSLGARTTYLGDDHGLSSLHDMATLGLMWGVLNGFLHGAALLGTAGVPATAFAPVASHSTRTVAGWLAGYARQIDDGTYPPLDSTIHTHVAAMEHLVHESESLGISAELPRFVKALADKAVADGHGGSGYAAMIERFRTPAGNAPPFDPRTLLAESRLGVLATVRSDGRPQLSPVMPSYDRQAGVVYVSMTEGRARTANLRRDPRATLEVTSPDGWSWATADGTATLTGPGTDPDAPEVEALVRYYRAAAGEHPDWDGFRSAMVSERRVLMTMTVDHVYGDRVR